ncbi:MAG TPA: 5-formyltetrahydrofolate cyclo-ligase [Gammaproteobacteria bacterium]|nr:5-formyltetrahydrofolate cyclo-ligase [Gammaproteobacteria bacterium]
MAEHGNGDDHEPSSPPCLMHEFADELVPRLAEKEWSVVQAFRKAKRAELLGRRGALTFYDREGYGEGLTAQLLATLDIRSYPVLGFYWPIRGEIDLRALARRHVEAGGIAALPVVVEKNEPVEFWQWKPDGALQRGFWNIPVPAKRRVVVPSAWLIPLVGYDAAGYRLGYGGGYYDRTLAESEWRPLCVGIGYDEAELATIHPQPHDVPMNLIVTERRVLRFARGALRRRSRGRYRG